MRAAIVIPSSFAFQRIQNPQNTDWSITWTLHGVASIISFAKSKGFDITLIDMRRCHDFADYLGRIKYYDMLFFSVNSIDFPFFAEKVLPFTKIKNPTAKIVVGGIHPTMKSEDFTKLPVDCVVVGEGEWAVVEIMQNGIKERLLTSQHVDVDEIPPIDRSLWEEEYPIGIAFSGQRIFYTLLTSRACLYNCSFCQPFARKMFGKEERRRSVDKVIEEMSLLRTKGMNSFMIHDDGFVQNKVWIDEFVEKYKQNFSPKPFIIQIRANHLCDESLVSKLKSIGLEWVILGAEHGSHEILKLLRKGCTREMNIKAVKTAKKFGIKVFLNLMNGFPEETKENIEETFTMLEEIGTVFVSFAYYSPYPGSDLHDYYERKGLINTEYADRNPDLTQKLKGVDYNYLNQRLNKFFEKHPRGSVW